MRDEKSAGRLGGSLFVVLGLCGPLALQAQVTAVTGAGSRSCEQMQTDIADLPNVRRAYVSWMQGYLSGRNAAREVEGLALVDLSDYEAQWNWIVDWCGARPERSFADAAQALFEERA
jgi:hypothetical protein